jgi:hypothetical protein
MDDLADAPGVDDRLAGAVSAGVGDRRGEADEKDETASGKERPREMGSPMAWASLRPHARYAWIKHGNLRWLVDGLVDDAAQGRAGGRIQA